MMWCPTCRQIVTDPEEHFEYDIPDAEAGGYEKIQILTCPTCGREVYQEPGQCVMCGEHIEPGKSLCEYCSEDITAMVDLLAEQKNLDGSAVKDGLAEYLNMEDR